MRSISTYPFRFALSGMVLAVVTAAGLAWAQDQPAAPPAQEAPRLLDRLGRILGRKP